MAALWILFSLSMGLSTDALDNGLALTPPAGWISGERFGCNTDCVNYPRDCLSENLVRSTAQAMVSSGFQRAGFNYIILADCWQAKSRDHNGQLHMDVQRFPSGLKSLADYVHALGLNLGVSLSTEETTCNGYPGSKGRMAADAIMLASSGIDMVNVDSCGIDRTDTLAEVYEEFELNFNRTGRPVLFMCNWPYYQRLHGVQVEYQKVKSTCNIFRESDEMEDSWEDLAKILKYFGDNAYRLVNYTGPGSWNYADPVLVGNYGLSINQQKLQVALWSIMASPLFVSADLRQTRPEFNDILLNPRILAINRDPLGIMGKQVQVAGQVKIWVRPTMPRLSFALVFVYTNISGGPSKVSVKLFELGLMTAAAYNFTDVFTGDHIGIYKPWHTFNCEVNPTGTVFIHAVALS